MTNWTYSSLGENEGKIVLASSWRKTTAHGSRRTSLRSDELRLGRRFMAENDTSSLWRASPPQASRVSRSFKAVRVDWFDRFIETYNFMGPSWPLSSEILQYKL